MLDWDDSDFDGFSGSEDDKEEQLREFDGVVCEAETEKALLVIIGGDKHWMPKSQIRDGSEVNAKGDEGKLVVTEWIAEQKGI